MSRTNLSFFCDPIHGSNSNNGLSPTTAWRDLQFAADSIYGSVDFKNNTITLNCALGEYTSGIALNGRAQNQRQSSDFNIVGAGTVGAKFQDCLINPTVAGQPCIFLAYGAMAQVQGFMLAGMHNNHQDLVDVGVGSVLQIGALGGSNAAPVMCFGPAMNAANHITLSNGSGLTVYQPYGIFCQGIQAQCHIDADNAWCYYNTNGVHGLLAVSLYDATNFVDSFVRSSFSDLSIQAVGWACYGGALVNTRTCVVEKNGVIDTGSGANPNYFPGNIGPLVQTGGQYI